jgi:hypothetical protein
MWLLHITDHSTHHTSRIWACAAYAWVAKHLTYNMQRTMKEWLVRLLEGRTCFEEDDEPAAGEDGLVKAESSTSSGQSADSAAVREAVRERWTAMSPAVDVAAHGPRVGAGAASKAGVRAQARSGGGGSGTAARPPPAPVKKRRKLKERPFRLDAWAFSYAN